MNRWTTSQLHNLAVELADPPLDGVARFEQRAGCSHQFGTTRDQLPGSHGEDIERGAADHKTEVLEKASDMVLKIALDLDHLRPAGQQGSDRMALDAQQASSQ